MAKPDTFSQMYIYVVFAVKGRANVIREQHREQVQRYMTGIAQNRKVKVLAIYVMPNHAHILLSINPTILSSELVQNIKTNATIFIKEQGIARNFAWQEGYGIFTVSTLQKTVIYNYIINQPEHHRTRSFKEEYIALLRKNEIEFDEKYLFEWYDDDG